jgi:hypothetical protein
MSQVMLYLCEGEFVGKPVYDYHHPVPGAVHSFLLFLRQTTAESSMEKAEQESVKYGFSRVTVKKSNLLSVEAMNTDAYKGFSGHYEEALSEGSSIVWYPNA